MGMPASCPGRARPRLPSRESGDSQAGMLRLSRAERVGSLSASLFCFILFHYVLVLSHCSEVSFSGWWIKECLTLYKSGPTTSPAEGEEMGASVVRGGEGRYMGGSWGHTQDLQGLPQSLWGCSVLQLSQQQPTWLRNYSWNISTCAHVPCHPGRHPDCRPQAYLS